MTRTEDDRLTGLLYAETDNPPPPNINLSQVLRDGRRRKRRRLLLVPASAAVLVVGVVVGAAVVVGPGKPASTSTVDVGSSSGPPGPSQTAPSAPTEFYPTVIIAQSGWTDGLREIAPMTSTTAQKIMYSDALASGTRTKYFEVTIYARGVRPWQFDGSPPSFPKPTMTPAAPVHGATAQRLLFKDMWNQNGLAWQWAPGAWAVARASTGYRDNQEAVERLIAENVRTDVVRPVRERFSMAAPPEALHIAGTKSDDFWDSYRQQVVSYEMADSKLPYPMDPTAPHPAPQLVIAVSPTLPDDNRKPQNATIEGHPARIDYVDGAGGSIHMYDVSGFDILLTVSQAVASYVSKAQAVALIQSVRIVP